MLWHRLFDQWSGDVPAGKEHDNPLIIWMDDYKNLSANFTQVSMLSTISADLTCQPSIGTLPLETQLTVTLINNYIGQTRRIACHLDALLAGGNALSNWRAGYTNVAADSSHQTSWSLTIPLIGSVIGENVFTLMAEDVTPPPYNQPPYPPARDTDTDMCAVTGVAP